MLFTPRAYAYLYDPVGGFNVHWNVNPHWGDHTYTITVESSNVCFKSFRFEPWTPNGSTVSNYVVHTSGWTIYNPDWSVTYGSSSTCANSVSFDVDIDFGSGSGSFPPADGGNFFISPDLLSEGDLRNNAFNQTDSYGTDNAYWSTYYGYDFTDFPTPTPNEPTPSPTPTSIPPSPTPTPYPWVTPTPAPYPLTPTGNCAWNIYPEPTTGMHWYTVTVTGEDNSHQIDGAHIAFSDGTQYANVLGLPQSVNWANIQNNNSVVNVSDPLDDYNQKSFDVALNINDSFNGLSVWTSDNTGTCHGTISAGSIAHVDLHNSTSYGSNSSPAPIETSWNCPVIPIINFDLQPICTTAQSIVDTTISGIFGNVNAGLVNNFRMQFYEKAPFGYLMAIGSQDWSFNQTITQPVFSFSLPWISHSGENVNQLTSSPFHDFSFTINTRFNTAFTIFRDGIKLFVYLAFVLFLIEFVAHFLD